MIYAPLPQRVFYTMPLDIKDRRPVILAAGEVRKTIAPRILTKEGQSS